MALPHMPAYWTTRKNIYEAAIVQRRTKEEDFRHKWTDTANYFHTNDVAANKKKAWESEQSFRSSMDAWGAGQEKEAKAARLEERKKQLTSMLADERERFRAELRGLSKDHSSLLDDMQDRCETLRSAREEKRQNLAQEKLYQHWRTNNPDLKRMEIEQRKQAVVGSWAGQLEENAKRAEEERKAEEELQRRLEADREEAQRLADLEEQKRQTEQLKVKQVLRTQMSELQDREKEAKRLKLQEAALQQEQWRLEQAEQERKKLEDERKKLEFGRILLRQHTTALRKKSKLIQKELEEDQKFLQNLLREQEEEVQVKTARREKAKADASWMNQVISEQIKVEKAREAELDMLFQDEAARVWEKREGEWQRERVARERLMKEVMDERQDQIQAKMETVRRQQEESLQRREELLEDLDRANQLTRRQQEEEEHAKTARKQELESQISARREGRRQVDEDLRLELAEEKAEEDNYDEFLQQEAVRLNLQGYSAKDQSRRQAWM